MQLVAWVADQARVLDWPAGIDAGLALKLSVGGVAGKFAVTLLLAVIVTGQVGLVPVHAPLQPEKLDPAAALAVRVTLVPLG